MAPKAREKDGGATDGAHAGGPVVVWFRNDLRVKDNLALSKAVDSDAPVIALFILDEAARAPRKLGGARRWWLHHSLVALEASLAALNIPLILKSGESEKLVRAVVDESGAGGVFWNSRLP
jgi:deoxyribodipyrimidine photo-lyase